jgi:1-acyl-sn-glycerol-3-phosphate acyltransferase
MVARRAEQSFSSAADADRNGWPDRVVSVVRGLGVAFAIAYFWTGGFVLAWLVLPALTVLERDPLVRRRRMQRVVAAIWRSFHRGLEATALFRYRYQGTEPPPGPAVFIANHPTLLDVTAIICRWPHVCCVVKSSLVESPLVGRLLRSCGHVAAGDGGLMSGAAVLDTLCARIAEGFPVLVFPEGTRSPGHQVTGSPTATQSPRSARGLHRMRRGAFDVARRSHVPLVPLFLHCDPPALGKGTSLWEHPRFPTLTIHIDPVLDMSAHKPRSACRELEADFRRRLGLGECQETVA